MSKVETPEQNDSGDQVWEVEAGLRSKSYLPEENYWERKQTELQESTENYRKWEKPQKQKIHRKKKQINTRRWIKIYMYIKYKYRGGKQEYLIQYQSISYFLSVR